MLEVHRGFFEETDRGAAILGAAALEEELTEFILSRLVNKNGNVVAMFTHHGALGTFGAKIDIAHAIGFIDENVHHDLDSIRNIRNAFAHNILYAKYKKQKKVEVVSFRHRDVRQLVLSMKCPQVFRFGDPNSRRAEKRAQLRNAIAEFVKLREQQDLFSDARLKYEFTCGHLYGRLAVARVATNLVLPLGYQPPTNLMVPSESTEGHRDTQ
jgi:hypothetical protein